MPFPMPRPISGRRLAPKIMMIIMRMITSSGMPRRPIIRAPWTSRGESADCITVGGRAGLRPAGPLTWALLALTAASGAALSARQFTSGVNLVEVYASVMNERGETVKGLMQEDFELRENGEVQPISNFAAGEFPLSVAIALDRSFSMSGTRLALAKSAARAFLGELRPQDESMVLAIGSDVDVAAPLSTDRTRQFDALMRLDSFGTTGLH